MVVGSHARGVRGIITHAQYQVGAAANFFWDRIPTVVRDEIDAVEKELWEEVQTIPMEETWEEFEEWALDPSTIVGRDSTYERMMIAY